MHNLSFANRILPAQRLKQSSFLRGVVSIKIQPKNNVDILYTREKRNQLVPYHAETLLKFYFVLL